VPPRIEVNQRLAVQFPGWSAISDQIPQQFAGLTFFDGNPRDQASLAPDKQTTVNGKTVALWTFGVSGAASGRLPLCRHGRDVDAGIAQNRSDVLDHLRDTRDCRRIARRRNGRLQVIAQIDASSRARSIEGNRWWRKKGGVVALPRSP